MAACGKRWQISSAGGQPSRRNVTLITALARLRALTHLIGSRKELRSRRPSQPALTCGVTGPSVVTTHYGGGDAHRDQFTLLSDGLLQSPLSQARFLSRRVLLGSASFVSLGAPDGFTMASGAASPDIRMYIKDYEPCGKDPRKETFLLIAHELVHVVQIQGMLGGGRIPGSWMAYYTSQLFNCTRGRGTCANLLEEEAYAFANGTSPGCGTVGQVRGFVDERSPPRSLATAARSRGRSPTRSAGRLMPRRCTTPDSPRPRATSDGAGARCCSGPYP